ncbi:aminotransferase class III-fold pyridoxal phosphate-dependent enzyme, partial [Streptosporangium algeriense]
VGLGAAGTLFAKGDHGSTFGGNPVSAAAALAVLETIESQDLLGHVKAVGTLLSEGIAAVEHPLLKGVRGQGLWLAVVLTAERAGRFQEAAQRAGFLVNAVQPDAVRLAPPLVITEEQVTAFVTALPALLDEASHD